MQPRISMITLGVDSVEKSVAFYKKLGFPCYEETPDVAFFNLNGTWLGLYGQKALAEDAQVPFRPGEFNSCTLAHTLSSEAEVDKVFSEAIEAGATFVKKPQKVFWGGYSSYFKDPDGHLWEVAYNPFAWIGPKDDDNES